jgi:hypothetical protein
MTSVTENVLLLARLAQSGTESLMRKFPTGHRAEFEQDEILLALRKFTDI